MKSFKKSILNVCNKLMQTAVTQSQEATKQQQEPATKPLNLKLKQGKKLRYKSVNYLQPKPSTKKTSTSTIGSACESISLGSPDDKRAAKPASSSSGYGTSIESANSVFVNLDNYFYDENFSKIKTRAQENNLNMKRNVIQCLLQYQLDYLRTLQTSIESYVRPMGVLMDERQYFGIFQNVEKICAMTEFVRNTINDSMMLTLDIYKSTVTTMYEYISMIVNTYETYVQGYEQALNELDTLDMNTLIKSNDRLNKFNAAEFIHMPIVNITKIYCAFSSLLEMTPMSDMDDYEQLNTVCVQLKSLIGDFACDLNMIELFNNEMFTAPNDEETYEEIYEKPTRPTRSKLHRRQIKTKTTKSPSKQSPFPVDFTDFDGNKHYFL